jgi:uncharacterized sporulation protein YeaH/YhbH (DUF444 family)
MVSIAERKRQENIAEFVLYVWQMEDLARAAQFDVEAISTLLSGDDQKSKEAETRWFRNLIAQMKDEGLEKTGHISELDEVMKELAYLHSTLLTVLRDEKYIEKYAVAQPNIAAFLSKSGGEAANDVDACLTALYGLMTLRLKRMTISKETEMAVRTFSTLMAHLSSEYHKMKLGEQNSGLN